MAKIGILLTNTGTPDAPTQWAVMRYLREFLSDKRVVKLPRLVWLPLLYGLILPLRSYKSARLYRSIWQEQGAPMRVYMQELSEELQASLREFSKSNEHDYTVAIGMNYGNPRIEAALSQLQQQGIDDLIVLPLYPQYSNVTTASTFDRVTKALRGWPILPHVTFIKDYHQNEKHISALANAVQDYWQQHGRGEYLLVSFHGVPERFIQDGDPYQNQCESTAQSLAAQLQLNDNEWQICYQSRFGYAKWLQPATFSMLEQLATDGIKTVDIICPGFSIDCLETLEEIAQRGKECFIHAGGKNLRYISALNSSAQQVEMLVDLTHIHS